MKRWLAYTLFTALTPLLTAGMGSIPAAQAAMQSSGAQSATTTGGSQGLFTVQLVKALDSKKLKEGDPVEAKLTESITLPSGATVPRGTKLIGHVTAAKARSKNDSESTLGIVFDKIVRPGVEATPIKGVIQAVAPNPNPELTTGSGVGYTDLKQAAAASAAPDGHQGSTQHLNDQSVGVLGIKNMQLGPEGALTSSGKEVKLDSGTQMLINVTMQ